MKTDVPGVDWLLRGDPRPVQLEALARSYTGYGWRDSKHEDMPDSPRYVYGHAGRPARGWCFFMEMRTGKTPTAINEAALFRRDHGLRRVLVISPNRYKHQWAEEMTAFGWDGPVVVMEPGKYAAAGVVMPHDGAVVIVNYEALRSPAALSYLETFVKDRCYVVADESVLIKAPASKSSTARNALRLASMAAVRRVLSGKPSVQGPHDLYNQFRFTGRYEGANYHQFKTRFCMLGGYKGKQVTGLKNGEQLEELLHKWSFRAQRVNWGTALAVDYQVAHVEMTKQQAEAYAEMEEEFMTTIAGAEIITEAAAGKHMKLQQLSSGFMYGEGGQAHWIHEFRATPKYRDLLDRLRHEISGRVLVLYLYRPTGRALLESLMEDYDGAAAFIGGGEDMKQLGRDAQEEKKRFNAPGGARVLVAQVSSIKYGHTLMGAGDDPCSVTVFYENSYSLDDRAQCEQRNQGEGQRGATTVIDYAASPVEVRVAKALQKKEIVSRAIMDYYKDLDGPA